MPVLVQIMAWWLKDKVTEFQLRQRRGENPRVKIKIAQVQIEKKGKNKSREEIFYQMKGFFGFFFFC